MSAQWGEFETAGGRKRRDVLRALIAGLTLSALPRVAFSHSTEAAADGDKQPVTRSMADYDIPSIALTREDGTEVDLADELAFDSPVFVNFLFTSCTAVCPVAAMVFSELQSRLPADGHHVQLRSISIDPLQDTPERLSEYAEKFDASADWHFLTGSLSACDDVQRAFDVYRGDKMNHPVVTFFRANAQARWVRLDGFATPDDLLNELHTSS